MFASFIALLGVLVIDSILLMLSNLLMWPGIFMLLGTQRTLNILIRKDRWYASIMILIGVFLMLRGWAIVGMLVEGFGFVSLFGNFFPVVKLFLKGVFISTKAAIF